MAEFNIEVQLDPRPAQRGTSQVERSLSQLENTTDRVRNTIRNVFVFAGVPLAIGEIVRLSDSFTQLQNRLRVVTNSQRELTTVTNDLFQISQSTRASFESTTELYTRLAISSSELGVNQRQLLGFTESLNQAIILSGASAQEANAGLIQLTQGLASGALRGDELRSVLEQLPVVADVIARQLGVTRGALRELGAQGRITANTIIDAFESAREEIAERFSRTIPTLAQSFVVLRNSFVQFFGEVSSGIGVSSGLSRAIISLANNLDSFVSILSIATVTTISYFASIRIQSIFEAIAAQVRYTATLATGRAVALGSAEAERQKAVAAVTSAEADIAATTAALSRIRAQIQLAVVVANSEIADLSRIAVLRQVQALEAQLAIQTDALSTAQTRLTAATARTTGAMGRLRAVFPGLTAAVTRFNAAVAANPLVAVTVGVIALVAALVAFGDEIRVQRDGLANFHDLAVVIWRSITGEINIFTESFRQNFSFLFTFAADVFSRIDLTIAGFLRLGARTIDTYIGIWRSAYNAILILWGDFPNAFDALVRMAVNAGIDRIESFINGSIRLFNQLFDALDSSFEVAELSIGRIADSSDPAVRRVGERLREALQAGFNFDFFSQGVENVLAAAEERAQVRIAEEAARERAEQNRALSGTQTTLADIIRMLEIEGELLTMATDEREVQAELLRIESTLRRTLNTTERETVLGLLRTNQELARQSNIIEDLRSPLIEYQNTLTSLNSLLEQGRINQLEFNNALAGTDLSQSLNQLRTDVDPTGQAGQLQTLQTQLSSRLLVIQQAQQARLISEQEALNLSLQANRAYNEAIMDLETNRQSTQLQAAQSTATSLAQITSGLVGEQNSAYQALFALSKGFAIADATVQISNAIAKAANTPFPANLAAISTVAAQTAGLISTIQSTNLPAFQNGGSFRVGGPGGTDSQLVAFRASPGEDVTIRTPGQQRSGNGNITFIQNIENRQSNNVSVQSTEPTVDDQGNVVIGIVVDALNRDANGITTQIRNIAQTRG